ncbi:MAG: sigma-70 family RNA polymerase sigma factor [Candidatus Tectomicrobia bacterium]|nr:sigma-70 family RNA polymerase sigma factor [Candidatus Tectomicrobia bacterium]
MDVDFSRLSDREIAQWLFEQYGKKLYYYAIKAWQLDEDEVWDALYDSLYGFIRAYADCRFSSGTDVETLLWKIFKNKLRDRYRQRKRVEKQYYEVPYDETLSHSGEGPLDQGWSYYSEHDLLEEDAENPAVRQLETILDGLKDWERQLLLSRANSIAYADIADMTGIKVESLKVYYQRLKSRISKEMGEYFASMEKEQ